MFCTKCGVALYEGAAACRACGQRVGAEVTQEAPLKVAYAGFWLRLVAAIIDYFVLIIPTFAIVVVAVMLGVELPDVPFGTFPPMRIFLPLEAMFLMVHWVYFATMESSVWQGTLGKRALKLGVLDGQGRRISFGRASGRFFGKVLSGMTFLLGYVMAGFTEKKQALHDILADCIVVKMP
jgi:uncharacterized RDD family membrane protein YckC